MAAVGLARLDGTMEGIEYNQEGSDVDAEGEEDIEMDYSLIQKPASEATENVKVSEDDGEVEEVDIEVGDQSSEEDEEEDFVGAVKLPNGRAGDSDEEAIAEDGSAAEEASELEEEEEEEDDDESDNSSSSSSSSGESAVAGEKWEGRSEVEDIQSEVANRNNCIFCGQDEEHDPCAEFEEYMACAVCGDNSHRQCARDAHSLAAKGATEDWRCPDCVKNSLEPDHGEQRVSRRQSSASRLTRDLLPTLRGISRPGSHSVFNTLILDDDPLDGSRSLRKRKASSMEIDAQSQASSKRRKQGQGARLARRASQSLSFADGDGAIEHDREGAIKGTPINDTDIGIDNNAAAKPRSTRSDRQRKLKVVQKPRLARIIRKNPNSLVLALPVDFARLKELQPKRKRRRPVARQSFTTQRPRSGPSNAVNYQTPFYSFHERENDELKSKPYGGILSEADADTSKTLPLAADRAKFEEARQKAEVEWKIRAATNEAENEVKGRASQKVSGPPSKIKCINFGGYEIETWYAAPYPEEYSRNRVLYICEFCLKYLNSDYVAWRHKLKCPAKHPPGDEIYRDNSISVFEVDGRKNPVYCQNLCLLAKLFLGSKTLYYDVEPFLFYIMTEYDEFGCHFVGYFSKEKRPSSMNNVSCILTLPIHQRKGYGNLLIDFSYLLTRREQKTGSPEKPLSDMGLVSYRNYWRLILSYQLLDQTKSLSITDISTRTGMTADDIVAALEALRALVRDPVTKTYALRLDHDYFKQCIEGWESKNYVKLNPDGLLWTPYLMGRGNLASYDRAPPLPTIAPREGEEDDEAKPPMEELIQQQLLLEANAQPTTENSPADPPYDPALIAPALTTPALLTPAASRPSPDIKPIAVNGTYAPPKPPSPIPPTRYEVFPPVSGAASRRRGGWRGGPRKSNANTGTTPARRALRVEINGQASGRGSRASPRVRSRASPRGQTGLGVGKGKGSPGGKATPSGRGTPARRTRSALGEVGRGLGEELLQEQGDGVDAEADAEQDDDDNDHEDQMEQEAAGPGKGNLEPQDVITATAAPDADADADAEDRISNAFSPASSSSSSEDSSASDDESANGAPASQQEDIEMQE